MAQSRISPSFPRRQSGRYVGQSSQMTSVQTDLASPRTTATFALCALALCRLSRATCGIESNVRWQPWCHASFTNSARPLPMRVIGPQDASLLVKPLEAANSR